LIFQKKITPSQAKGREVKGKKERDKGSTASPLTIILGPPLVARTLP